MKVKGVNWFEAHVEWVLVALLALAGLAAVAMQFVGQGNRVEVERVEYPLPEAYSRVVTEAQTVQGRLDANTAPEDLPKQIPDVATAVREGLREGVVSDDRLEIALTHAFRPVMEDSGGRVGPLEAVYAAVEAPGPTEIAARAYIATLDPVVVATNAALAETLGGESQPYDVRSVSVAASFDAVELLRRFSADPDGPSGPAQAIPRFLWNDAEIADVQLERERLGSDGRWTERTIVANLPGRASIRADLASVSDRSAKRRLDARAREARDQIVRPLYYRTIAGDDWAPPAAERVDGGSGIAANVARQIQRLISSERDLEDLRSQLESLEGDSSGARSDRAPDRRMIASSQPSGPFQPSAPSREEEEQQREERNEERQRADRDRRIKQLKDQITRTEERVEQLRTWLTDRGVDIEAVTGEKEAPSQTDWTPEPAQALNAGGVVRVWRHDVTVDPGETYRYRLRVLVMNPLYSMQENLREQDTQAASQPAVESPWSDWSGAVRVAPEAQVFFTTSRSGQDAAIGGGGVTAVSATAEVYRYFYGHWRQAIVRLSPGDAVSGAIEAPRLPLWDVQVAPDTGRVTVAQRAQGTPAMLPLETDAFLLDVIPQAESESGRGGAQVVFRDEGGRIEVRTPGADRVSPARRAAEESSISGLSSTPRQPTVVEGSGRPERASAEAREG